MISHSFPCIYVMMNGEKLEREDNDTNTLTDLGDVLDLPIYT